MDWLELMDMTNVRLDPRLTEDDVLAIFDAGNMGDYDEMRRIVESKGLIWHGALVETSHPQQFDE